MVWLRHLLHSSLFCNQTCNSHYNIVDQLSLSNCVIQVFMLSMGLFIVFFKKFCEKINIEQRICGPWRTLRVLASSIWFYERTRGFSMGCTLNTRTLRDSPGVASSYSSYYVSFPIVPIVHSFLLWFPFLNPDEKFPILRLIPSLVYLVPSYLIP